MTKKTGKKKFSWGKALSFLLYPLLGAAIGFLLAWYSENRDFDIWPLEDGILPYLALLAGFIASTPSSTKRGTCCLA